MAAKSAFPQLWKNCEMRERERERDTCLFSSPFTGFDCVVLLLLLLLTLSGEGRGGEEGRRDRHLVPGKTFAEWTCGEQLISSNYITFGLKRLVNSVGKNVEILLDVRMIR